MVVSLLYGPGDDNLPIWLKDIGCYGSEESLLECSNINWGQAQYCTHDDDDVGIACENSLGR